MADEYAVFRFIDPQGTGPIIRIDNGAGSTRDVLNFQKNSSEVFSVDSNGLPDPGGGDPKRSVTVSYGDIPADADAIAPKLIEFEKAVTITNIYVAVDTAVASCAGADKQTLLVKNGDGDTTIATLALTANPGMAQNTWTTMGAITNASIAADSYCYGTFTKTGAGVAMSGIVYRVEYTLAG